jgi:hypothetical protein
MSRDDPFKHTPHDRLILAELSSLLIEADLRQRSLYPRNQFWPVDIGFAHSPMSEWLIRVVQDVMDSDDRGEQRCMAVLEHDQHRLLGGWRPGTATLDHAPSIRPEKINSASNAECQIIYLTGFVRNVAGGGPDRRRITSPIIAFDAARFEWVRTLSRFYGLEWDAAQTVQQ